MVIACKEGGCWLGQPCSNCLNFVHEFVCGTRSCKIARKQRSSGLPGVCVACTCGFSKGLRLYLLIFFFKASGGGKSKEMYHLFMGYIRLTCKITLLLSYVIMI